MTEKTQLKLCGQFGHWMAKNNVRWLSFTKRQQNEIKNAFLAGKCIQAGPHLAGGVKIHERKQ